jgi:hypothetical protein
MDGLDVFSKDLTSLGLQLSVTQGQLLTPTDILRASEQVCPCPRGMSGGLIFQKYIINFGSRVEKKQMSSLFDFGETRAWQKFVEAQSTQYYSFVLQQLFTKGRYVDDQFLARTLLAQTCGLSNSGRHVLAKMHVLMPPTTYRKKIDTMLAKRAAVVAASENVCVTWLDNYSRMFPRGVIRHNQPSFNQNLWTVEARIMSVASSLPISLKNGGGSLLPTTLFDRVDIEQVFSELPHECVLEQAIALTQIWDVRTVPPRLPSSGLSPDQVTRATQHSQFYQRFVPQP